MVLDEADLLLSGGFERDVQRILDGMKQSDRERKAQQTSRELGIPLESFQALPRHLKLAAYEGTGCFCHVVVAAVTACLVVGKEQQTSRELGIPSRASQAVPRHLKLAAYKGTDCFGPDIDFPKKLYI